MNNTPTDLMFTYDQDNTENSVGEILASLSDTVNLDGLDELIDRLKNNTYLFDVDNPDTKGYVTYSSIVDEVIGRLIDCEYITEDFNDTHPDDFDELSDYIDDEIVKFIEVQIDFDSLLLTLER